MKIGLVSYTNVSSGIGVFGRDFVDCLGIDSVLSIGCPEKGQYKWMDNQITAQRPPTNSQINGYLTKYSPDVVLFMETPFAESLYDFCQEKGIKTAGISMHETFSAGRLKPDLIICPCPTAYAKAGGNKTALFLPISIKPFRYRQRKGHTFVVNLGYGGVNDRRQSKAILRAFEALEDPDARLIVNAQSSFPDGCNSNDPRVTFNLGSKPNPADTYLEGDIYLGISAYGGYERPILEAMSSGMPTLVVDADPMNLFQHDPLFRIQPFRQFVMNSQWVVNTVYNEVSWKDLHAKLEELMTIDTAKYSKRARKQAEAQSWEKNPAYKKVWKETLEGLCS